MSTLADRAEATGRVPHETADTAGKAAASLVRQTIATRMLAAAQQTAAVTLTASADATELVKLRQEYRTCTTDCAAKLPSYTALLVKVVGHALQRHLNMLGQWTNERIVVPDGVHIAVAVDTPVGLMTPVLRDVPALSLAQVSERLSNLISRARTRGLLPEELQGGTFTVTNLGAYRVDAFTPLLNLPQSSILGVGRISSQPVAVERSVEVRDRVTLSLTFDHRAADGAAAAALLTTICELVERPLPTLLS
jgi:pyruvate dehydrogenase E2 component (dihydrolipoamide acetyltransferase)